MGYFSWSYVFATSIGPALGVAVGDARGIAGIAFFFTANAITLFITRPPAGRFADRHGISALFFPACFFEALAMTLLAFSQQLWLFLVAAALKALGLVTPIEFE